MKSGNIATVAALSLLSASVPVLAQAPQYTFTRVADTSHNPGFAKPSCVAVNSLGTVLVKFAPAPNAASQLWRSKGTNFIPVAIDVDGDCPSLNDSDEFAYVVVDAATGIRSLIRNSNGTLTTIARSDLLPYLSSAPIPSLNNNGRAVYIGGAPTRPNGVFIAPGSIPVYVPDSNTLSFTNGTMNDTDTAVVVAVRLDPTSPTGTRTGIYRGSNLPLVDDGVAVPGGSLAVEFTPPVINESGTVAFVGTLGGLKPVRAFTTVDGLSFDTVGTGDIERLSINDSGVVLFGRRRGGIYIGRPGAINQKLIRPGDPLDGSIVDAVSVWEKSLNNRGQVAFYAKLKDGRHGVYRADPLILSSLFFTSATAACGDMVGSVTLGVAAPPGGATVSLESTNIAASVPASVFVPAGRTTATFSITPTPVLEATTGAIVATWGSDTISRTLTIRPVGVRWVRVRRFWIEGVIKTYGHVLLDCDRVPLDVTVSIASTNPTVLEPTVDSLLFTAGTLGDRAFEITAHPVLEPMKVTIRASANGIVRSRTVIVYPE